MNSMIDPSSGWTLNSAVTINSAGNTIGAGTKGSQTFEPYFFDGTTVHDIGTLGGTSTQANGINDLNQVVGQSFLASGTDEHAFLYTVSDGIVDLNPLVTTPGWDIEVASGINDSGQIVGLGIFGGVGHAVLLTPVPEPSAVLLMLWSVLLLFGIRRASFAKGHEYMCCR